MEEQKTESADGGRQRSYIAIDLKSFYASVECMERERDPLDTNLVVADASRTEKTICLAVSPSLKRYGIPGRARLFEVVQRVKEVNRDRLSKAPGGVFTGMSDSARELDRDPSLGLAYITATPQMAHYMSLSTRIYDVYMKYVSPEDVHVYSIDEVFIDVTSYLNTYHMTPHQLAMTMVRDVLRETGITATAGIGTNLYLAKIAMDIVAKKMPADADGVRVAELDEISYREQLWNHRPLTDFWRLGPGYARKLEAAGLMTMGDVARCSVGRPEDYYNPDLLYKLFGVNAELLIDHAWGWEPVTIPEIKAYQPESNSLSSGQVLHCAYTYDKARLVVREMMDLLSLDLVAKGLLTDMVVLDVGYDVENLLDPARRAAYHGQVVVDRYGREVPKGAHGSLHLKEHTSSTRELMEAVTAIFDREADPSLLVRRMNISVGNLIPEAEARRRKQESYEQLDLFTDYEALERERRQEAAERQRERKMQDAILNIRDRFGKNAILKGMNLEEGATAADRNSQIGGHKA